MKCLNCGYETFVLESIVALKETYGIYKNGRVSKQPHNKEIVNDAMAENDHIVRCSNCNTGYLMLNADRDKLLHGMDYSNIDLEKDAEITEY